ncbi:acid trehalase [Phlyctema vagabunda]|uniref:alpha,alpha-trehalase n=1 Tax=Phlyctema vagabunda TaxID=108571 RepID=A0ABR4PX91_9HELO
MAKQRCFLLVLVVAILATIKTYTLWAQHPACVGYVVNGHGTIRTAGSSCPHLSRRSEVNPVAQRHRTIPDPDMDPLINFGVLSEAPLCSWDDETMTIMASRFIPGQYQTRLHIANGYTGSAVAMAGPFYEKDINQTNRYGNVTEGWPVYDTRQTFSTIGGFFDSQAELKGTNFEELKATGWESVISGIPHPLGFNLVVDELVLNSTIDSNEISDFSQTLSFRDGVTNWSYTWSPRDIEVSFEIAFTSIFSRVRLNLAATEFRITPRGGNYNVSVVDLLDGRNAKRSALKQKGLFADASIFVANHPDGMLDVEAWVVSSVNISRGYASGNSRTVATIPGNENEMTIGQSWDVELRVDETAVFQKFVGMASTDKFSDAAIVAKNASHVAMDAGWETILAEHVAAWNKLMERNRMASYRDPDGHLPSNDSTTEALQIAAIADRFYILQNLLKEDGSDLNDHSVAVGGLTSDSYGGMIFWDAEIWVLRGMVATDPDYVRQIIKYRLKKYGQAKANAQLPYVKEQYGFSENAVLYPWTSGRTGNATSTGPVLNYEYHLNTDIALVMLWYRAVTGDEAYFREELWPVIESIGETFATLLQKNGDKWSIYNMTDPDEFSNHRDDGAFLLASVSTVLTEIIQYQRQHGFAVNETWVDMADNVNIHRADSGITLEYDHFFNNSTIKQADISLLTAILDWKKDYSPERRQVDLDYYMHIQTTDGPAMTYAVSAIAENQNARNGCAVHTYELQSKLPHLRAPWYLMSEQANDDNNENGGFEPAFPFITGHGGNMQIILFGYLGLALDKAVLTINPSLPVYKFLRPPDFTFRGARFRAAMNSTHTNLTRIPAEGASGARGDLISGPVPVSVGRSDGGSGQRNYTLEVNQTITVENDLYWRTKMNGRNLLQCQNTAAKGDVKPGQYGGAATDGNSGTSWQPLTPNKTHIRITMDESVKFQRVVEIKLDWGPRTPKYARVGLTNSSNVDSFDSPNMTVIEIPDIAPDRLYGQDTPNLEVLPYIGNQTTYSLHTEQPEIWSARYVFLEIEGCIECGRNEWRLDNGTVLLGDEDGYGATVGEFKLIGTKGADIKKVMDDSTPDERTGAEP